MQVVFIFLNRSNAHSILSTGLLYFTSIHYTKNVRQFVNTFHEKCQSLQSKFSCQSLKTRVLIFLLSSCYKKINILQSPAHADVQCWTLSKILHNSQHLLPNFEMHSIFLFFIYIGNKTIKWICIPLFAKHDKCDVI